MHGTGRVIIGGATGFIGPAVLARQRRLGREVVTVGRDPRSSDLTWDDDSGIAQAVDGAALVVGLAGKSVNCRYTSKNRDVIMRSRIDTTAALSRAISGAVDPPPLWINAATATIYRHAMDRPQTEADGEIGEGFSVDVARAWEQELYREQLPNTRRVALRTTIALGDGGVLTPLKRLARLGLGGPQWDGAWPTTRSRRAAGTAHVAGSRRGAQKFSWVHLDDIVRMIDFIEAHPEIEGAVNAASPEPSDNRAFMRAIREAVGAPFGLPTPRFLLELGAIGIRTETELILKSRWVLPGKLQSAGFEFAHRGLDETVRGLLMK